jgi:iron complex outermembrane receptor protein
MSELIQKNDRAAIRWKLLTSASALALTACVSTMNVANAEDADRPLVWIEIGGQFDRFSGQGSPFTPPFVNTTDWSADNLKSPAGIQTMHLSSIGGDASISFEPTDSDWVFSAAVRYGRSNGQKFVHQQRTQTTRFQVPGHFGSKYFTKTAPPSYAQTGATRHESHFIADFQAGKDVGLGMFGHDATSVFGVGIRFAQLIQKAQTALYAQPGVKFVPGTFLGSPAPTIGNYHRYYAKAQRASSFRGIGPSISWNASAPVLGNAPEGEITVDWGANAAMLFGRQKAKAHHHTTGSYRYGSGMGKYHHRVTAVLPPGTGRRTQSRSLLVPDLGGFAGLSFRYSNAKLSLGYRGDFFFNAMDTGIATRRSENVGFYGPFASISIGLGG